MKISYARFNNVFLDSSVKELLSAFMRSRFRAVFEPFLGHIVTWGNSSSSRGRVDIEVDMGLSCQSKREWLMITPAAAKPRQTIINQTHFSALVWRVYGDYCKEQKSHQDIGSYLASRYVGEAVDGGCVQELPHQVHLDLWYDIGKHRALQGCNLMSFIKPLLLYFFSCPDESLTAQ